MSVSLVKGGKVNLTKEAGGTLNKLTVGLGWDAKRGEASGAEFDLDASALMLGSDGKVLSDDHLVFYGSRLRERVADGSTHFFSPEKSVTHTGDNLTGDGDGDDEVILVDLAKVPTECTKIVLTVSIFEAATRKQNFGLIDNSYIRALGDNGQELAKYELDMEAALETVVTFGELVSRNGEWVFSANSAGFPGGFDGLLRQYGVNVD